MLKRKEAILFLATNTPDWYGNVPLCGTGSNPHFLFALPKRKRPFMVKRKGAVPNLHLCKFGETDSVRTAVQAKNCLLDHGRNADFILPCAPR